MEPHDDFGLEAMKLVPGGHVTILFRRGDSLSQAQIEEITNSEFIRLLSSPPKALRIPGLGWLGLSRVVVIVYVFESQGDFKMIAKKMRRSNVMSKRYLLSWVLDLNSSALRKATGLPIVPHGRAEIEKALGL